MQLETADISKSAKHSGGRRLWAGRLDQIKATNQSNKLAQNNITTAWVALAETAVVVFTLLLESPPREESPPEFTTMLKKTTTIWVVYKGLKWVTRFLDWQWFIFLRWVDIQSRMPSFISDEDCSWPPIREHEGNIVFDIHTNGKISQNTYVNLFWKNHDTLTLKGVNP